MFDMSHEMRKQEHITNLVTNIQLDLCDNLRKKVLGIYKRTNQIDCVEGTIRFRYIYKRRTAIFSVLHIVNNMLLNLFVCVLNRRGKGSKVYLKNLEHIQVHLCDQQD